jgi:hypothetical protein
VTFYESNREVGPTGEEAGEFVDDGPLTAADADADADPSRRPTGSLPLPPQEPRQERGEQEEEEDGEPAPPRRTGGV